MTRKSTNTPAPNRMIQSVCALWLLLSLAALPAYGQHVHQLSYNGSTWVDQQLPGAQTYVFTPSLPF